MIQSIALIPILGRPLFIYFGLLAFLCYIVTAIIGRLNFKGKYIIPFKWHPRFAMTALAAMFIHAFLALSLFLNF